MESSMQYWKDDQIMVRDVLEGEAIFDMTHPHPAYHGMQILDLGVDYLYEVEIVPGSDRMGAIVAPGTIKPVYGTVIDVIYRRWDDAAEQWNEMRFPSLLHDWGFKTVPDHRIITQQLSNFDRAMKGI